VLERAAAEGLLGAGGQARTDSTAVVGRIRELHTLELVVETLRAALEVLAVADPEDLDAKRQIAALQKRARPVWRGPSKKDQLSWHLVGGLRCRTAGWREVRGNGSGAIPASRLGPTQH
jgi:hypothetical protein